MIIEFSKKYIEKFKQREWEYAHPYDDENNTKKYTKNINRSIFIFVNNNTCEKICGSILFPTVYYDIRGRLSNDN